MDFSDPEKNIRQFKLQEGNYVADLGAGSGFYSIETARIVGDRGRVYAVEVQKELVQSVKNKAISEHLHNVEVVWGDIEEIEGTKLKEGSVDAVILSNIIFQIEDKQGLINETKRILKKNGRLLIIDWTDSHGGLGPENSAVFPMTEARSLFEQNGFVFEDKINAGAHHYGFTMNKI